MTPTPRRKIVVAHSVRADAPQHEVQTNKALARWLAQILGFKFGGSYDPQKHRGRDLYLLPTQTIVGATQAHDLGIKGPDDLWGGFVEHDFICTKAISHGLRSHLAHAPQGWSPLFSERVRNVVLDGLSVFALEDARPAAEHLLYSGPIRLKPVHACAGRGQEVIKSLDAFDEILARPDIEKQFSEGVVLEQDLSDVITHSVGQSFIGDKVLSYCGDQYLTKDAHGEDVYGGSNLLVVQGGYDDLLALELPDDVRLAIEQAQIFDSAADEAYPAFLRLAAQLRHRPGPGQQRQNPQRRARTILAHGRRQQRRSRRAAKLRQRSGDARDSRVLGGNLYRSAAAGGRHRGVSRPG